MSLVTASNCGSSPVKSAAPEEVGVQAGDLVAALQQHGDQDGADVAAVSGNQNAHTQLLQVFQGGEPSRQSFSSSFLSRSVSMHCQNESCW